MRSLLGCLLCLVFGTAQTFAVKGGPGYGGGQVRTTGIYAGVLTPGPLSPGANSLGLFSVTIPRTGIGTGNVVIFAAGETYVGTILGIADPDSAKISGEINASFPISTTVRTGGTDAAPIFTIRTTIATAAGRLQGQIVANQNRFSSASARIIGTSNIQFSIFVNSPFTQIGYVVLGFKQSEI